MPLNRTDLALTLAACAGGVWLMLLNVGTTEVDVPAVAVPAVVVITLPLLWRSTAPLWALAAVLAGVVVHTLAFGEAIRCGIVYPVTWLLAYAAGSRLDRDGARKALALAVLAQLVMGTGDHAIDTLDALVLAPITWGVWKAGRVSHARGELVAALQERTAELRRARDERARLEVATDRVRLSDQLDAVLPRRLAHVAALADEGAHEDDPARARRLLEQIETASRGTLDEMRAVVGVLRDAPTQPLPALVHLERLLAHTRAQLQVEGSPRVLPVGVELSAYRAVEHLLAALEDAGDVQVTVRFGDDALEIAVSGPARRRADEAIERARERVELHAGTLVSTTRGGRAEAVVHLPVLARV